MPTPRLLRRLVLPLLVAVVALVGVGTAGSSTASAADRHLAAAMVCYNTSDAGEFAGTAVQAAGIWNGAENNVQLSQCGSAMTIHEIYTGQGSYTQVYGLGYGDIYIDYYQAQQYSPLRIVAHEMGHVLGLPDNYNGDCSILMSGGSAGYSCTNPYPSAGEAAQVDANFGGYRSAIPVRPHIYRDSWPTAA